ncbi:MAG: CoA-binding protein [Candidatus Doudnabacteria bacterium]|nr:CoA-binding protein [Candidatus Doudnabacteria bacterium]MCA9387783.1 CoA-binding protein [Candidatus Andersenbacteria bacterium]
MDYSSLLPSFENILPELLNKQNRLLLIVSKEEQSTKDLESALKKDGYDVEILSATHKKSEFEKQKKECEGNCVAVVMTPPTESLEVVQEAIGAGIEKVWLDTGSESTDAIQFLSGVSVQFVHSVPLVREALNPTSSETTKFQRKDS